MVPRIGRRASSIGVLCLWALAMTPATSAHASQPWTTGTLFIADDGHRTGFGNVFALAPGGSPSSIAFGTIDDVNVDAAGNVYYTNCSSGGAYRYTPGVGSALLGSFTCPTAIAVESSGDILVGDFSNGGSLYSIPGGGGSPTLVESGVQPGSIAIDGDGNVWLADGSNNLEVMVGGATPVIRISGTGYDGDINGVRVDGSDNLFASTAFFHTAVELPAGGGASTNFGTGLSFTLGVATDGSDVFIADPGSSIVVKVSGGVQTTVAGSGLDYPRALALWPPPAPTARIASTTTLTSTTAPPISTLTNVHLVAKVTSSGSKTGLVQFDANGQPLGDAVPTSSGVAKLTTLLPAGTNNVTATFLGNAGTNASQSSTLAIVVNPLASHTTLTTPGSLTTKGDTPVTLTATVVGSRGIAPTGGVEFKVNGLVVDGASLDSGGVASVTRLLPPGNPKVTAVYDGDPIYKKSTSNSLIFTVTPPFPVGLSTSVTLGPPNGSGAAKATITVTVTGLSGLAAPSGTVTADHSFTCGALTAITSTKSRVKCSRTVPLGFTESVALHYSGDSTYDAADGSQFVFNGGG